MNQLARIKSAGALLFTGQRLHQPLRLRMPVLVIAQKETLTMGVQCRVQEQADQFEVSHFLEPAIRRLYRSADDSKFAALHFLA